MPKIHYVQMRTTPWPPNTCYIKSAVHCLGLVDMARERFELNLSTGEPINHPSKKGDRMSRRKGGTDSAAGQIEVADLLGNQGNLRQTLEMSRRELLDLSLRNTLLNYRTLRARGLEMDAVPAHTSAGDTHCGLGHAFRHVGRLPR